MSFLRERIDHQFLEKRGGKASSRDTVINLSPWICILCMGILLMGL
jgi:hypothetical protein